MFKCSYSIRQNGRIALDRDLSEGPHARVTVVGRPLEVGPVVGLVTGVLGLLALGPVAARILRGPKRRVLLESREP